MSERLTPYQQMRKAREEQLAEPKVETPSVRPYGLPPEVAEERRREKNRRNVESRRRALTVLATRHEEEYAALLATERAALDEEKGPLPGDPA